MKNKSFLLHLISGLLLLPAFLLISCNKEDEFTIEDKDVAGNFTYTRTAFIPLTFDSTGLIPLSAQISMVGDGTVSDMGDIHLETTFKFDFILGMGYDFVTTYTGTSPADTFQSKGTSQVQPNGSIIVEDELGVGAGKFSKISGGGITTVWLNQAQDGGTGEVDWTVTF